MVVEGSRTVAAVARELGIGPGTLGRWVSGYRGSKWAEQVARHFGFVTEYGFVRTDVDAATPWEVRATYRAQGCALAVIRSHEFQRVEVQLMRLVDGQLPAYPIFIVDAVAVDTFYLDELLALRRPGAQEFVTRQRGLSAEEIEAQLVFWSGTLREYGQDFLAGDLRVLDELEQIVRNRAGQHRPEVVVWLPGGATAEDEARAVERARTGIPEGVIITTRRYRPAP